MKWRHFTFNFGVLRGLTAKQWTLGAGLFLLGVFSTHLPQVFKKSVKVMSQVLGADAVKKSLPVGVASLERKDI